MFQVPKEKPDQETIRSPKEEERKYRKSKYGVWYGNPKKIKSSSCQIQVQKDSLQQIKIKFKSIPRNSKRSKSSTK